MVWISATGSKYHSIPDCGNMNPDKAYQEPVSQAEAHGYEALRSAFDYIYLTEIFHYISEYPFFIWGNSGILERV